MTSGVFWSVDGNILGVSPANLELHHKSAPEIFMITEKQFQVLPYLIPPRSEGF